MMEQQQSLLNESDQNESNDSVENDISAEQQSSSSSSSSSSNEIIENNNITEDNIDVNSESKNIKPQVSINEVNNNDDDDDAKRTKLHQSIQAVLDAENKLYKICDDLCLDEPYFKIIERIRLNDRKYYVVGCMIIDQCNRELEFKSFAISKRMARLCAAMKAVFHLETNVDHIINDDETKKIEMNDNHQIVDENTNEINTNDNDDIDEKESKIGMIDDDLDADTVDESNDEEPPRYEDSQTPTTPKTPKSPDNLSPLAVMVNTPH
ncbi:uncharacterized protein LOC142645474 [Dermatophagoides pteronyssinus]|uniref:uncharacterized protein LOC142645474 n=1 Tax=Dermatophagoides pteronyssinus TaxID=6956 RepID=UPI003F66C31E